MDFNTQRRIVKKLREKGKNPLLFIPCLIAACAVVLFMSACRAVDMALSDSEGNFLGIKRAQKKAPAAVPVPMPAESCFNSKKAVKKSPLPFRPLWQRAMSLLLACSFVAMSAEITASAEIFQEKVVVDSVQPITSEYFREKGYNLSGISELDLSSNFNKTSEYAVNVDSNAFRGMNALTTITLGYSENISFSNSLSDIAPDSTVFVRADTADEYLNVRRNKITNNSIGVVWDKGNIFYDKIPKDVLSFNAYSGVGKVILEWEDDGLYDGYRFYKFTGTKYQLIKSIPYTDSGLKTVGTKKRYEIDGSTSAAAYFIRPYVSVTKEIDGENYSAELTSRKFSKASGSVLKAGTPTLTYTMSNKKVNLKIKMPSDSSAPTCYMLFSRDDNDYSLIKKFSQSDFDTNGECNFTDPNLYSGKTRSYVVIAYYDVFGTPSDIFPESDTSTAEYTTKRSSRVDVNEAKLNSPQNLTVTPIKGTGNTDCYQGWSLVWDPPADSTEILDLISYKVYANGIEVASTKDTHATIPVDTQQGENITFSVSAVCDDGTISASEPVSTPKPIDVKSESVQLISIKGGNEKANLIFKPFGAKNDPQFYKTQYTIWGAEASANASAATRSINGTPFVTFTLNDTDCSPNNDKDGTYTYTLHPLTNDVKYNFWITSNAEKCNYPSVIKSVTPSEAPQPPENIIGKALENSAVITWDPVLKDDGSGTYADGYYVSVYKLGVSAPVINRVKCTEYTYTAEKLENDVEYYAEVSAYVIVNDSEIEGPAARSAAFKPTITVGDVLNLTVTPAGKVINISWTAVKGASEYILLRTDPNGTQREIYKGSQPSFVDSNVDNKTEYSYRVMAVRKVDGKDYPGEYSSEQRGMINYALGSVQGLTATGGDGCIILKWDKVDGADGYYVQYSIPDANSWTTIANVGKTTFTHTGLENDVVYEYRIIPYVTINNKEESADTYAQKVEGKSGINLPAPADFTVTAGDGQITLKWSAVKGAEGYNIYLVGYDGSKYLLDQVSKTTAIHTNLSNNTTFTYTVCAYKYVDGVLVKGDYAANKSATVGIELNAPTDVVAKAGKEQVSLSWKKSDGAEGYVVYAYNIASLSFTPVGIVTKTSFVHTGLIGGREYTYMIAAYKNVNGSVIYSGYSMAVTAIPESSGSSTPSGDNSNTEAGDYRIFITGTTPFGMSNSDLISAFAGKGAFNTDIDVRFTLSPDTVTSVQNVLNFYGEGIDSFLIYPMDISIYVAGTNTRATINEGQYLTLTIPVPDELLPYSEHISVVHVSDLNQLEILPSIHVNVGGVDCMQFTANSFSPYAFVVYLPEIGEDTGAGTPVTAQGTSGSGTAQSAVFSFRNTYLPAIYRRRARNKLYRIVRR